MANGLAPLFLIFDWIASSLSRTCHTISSGYVNKSSFSFFFFFSLFWHLSFNAAFRSKTYTLLYFVARLLKPLGSYETKWKGKLRRVQAYRAMNEPWRKRPRCKRIRSCIISLILRKWLLDIAHLWFLDIQLIIVALWMFTSYNPPINTAVLQLVQVSRPCISVFRRWGSS